MSESQAQAEQEVGAQLIRLRQEVAELKAEASRCQAVQEREKADRELRESQQQARYRVREQVWRMRRVADITLVLAAVSDSLRAMGVPFMYCGVNIVDREQHSVTTAYTMDQQGQWRRYEFSGDRLVVGFWERGEPVVRHDLWEDDPYQERVHLPRLRSVVDVPFSHGTLALSSREPRAFGDQHLALVLDMAGLLSEGFSRLEDLAALEQRNQELEAEMVERRRAEEQLKASLHEKEVLLKEIHHRVKNNLQIVSSLLNLQAGTIEDARTVAKLMDSRSRIESMALVHEKLYQSDTLDRISFGDYLRAVAAHVHGSYGEVGQRVRLRLEASPLVVDVDVAIPCGLVLNELLTNSLKYAFPDGRQGEILVELQALGHDRVRLRVSDDGVGLPAGLEIAQTHSLGMQLVGDLTTQLRGTLCLCREQGTAFEIVFPLAGT